MVKAAGLTERGGPVAVRELCVHPNTVGLRLKRVEELTGLSMQNTEALLQSTVALMAEDVLGPAGAD